MDVDFGGRWLFVLCSRFECRSRGHRGVCLFVTGVEVIGSNVLVCACVKLIVITCVIVVAYM